MKTQQKITIGDARKKLKLAQIEIAPQVPCSQCWWSYFENGHRQPTDEQKERIAFILGYDVSEILWPAGDAE